jgi:TRAP-type C4-dicarboxylate transport system substrate-binding protein
MNSIRATERQMRKLQKQRHFYDIKLMLLNNDIFKNLSDKDHRVLTKLIYKAEMMEMYMRDKGILRINETFEDIVEGVANMLNDSFESDEEDDDRDRREN